MGEGSAVSEAVVNFLLVVDGRPLREVVLAVGPGVSREDAARAWEELTTGTPAANAVVIWEESLDILECYECARRFSGGKLDPCPTCGGDGLIVEHAPEFAVRRWIPEEAG